MSSAEAAALVAETAAALGALGDQPANLVVAARRILERHPGVGPLWWVCSHLVVAADPYLRAHELSDQLHGDPTSDVLVDELPAGAAVLTGGAAWVAVPAFAERDDVAVRCLTGTEESRWFVRRLSRFGVDVEPVDPGDADEVAAESDVVLVGCAAASPARVLGDPDAAAAVAAGAAARRPVWLAPGVGATLPPRVVEAIAAAAADLAELDVGAVAKVVAGDGVHGDVAAALRSDAPLAPELLRAVPAR